MPYAVVPAGSRSNARWAAAFSPSTSMMSSEGAPRANEMTSGIVGSRLRQSAQAQPVGCGRAMLRSALRHVRANLVGYLALFVALGGTSYAAVKLPKDSVTATQIKAGAVRAAEVKNGSLGVQELSARIPARPR